MLDSKISFIRFLSRTFANHRTTEEEEDHFLNYSLRLTLNSRTLRHLPDVHCKKDSHKNLKFHVVSPKLNN